jgi:hypothetical protein
LNDAQIFYMLCLAALTVAGWRMAGFALACLWANAVATLTVALGMDLGFVLRNDATLFYMVIDAATGVALLFCSGLPRVLALLYVLTVPLYLLDLVAGMDTKDMFVFVYTAALLQLGALAGGIANCGGGRGGSGRRIGGNRALAAQGRNQGMGFEPVAQVSGGDQGRGLK